MSNQENVHEIFVSLRVHNVQDKFVRITSLDRFTMVWTHSERSRRVWMVFERF